MTDLPFNREQPVLVVVEVLEVLNVAIMHDYVAAIAPQIAGYGARNIAAGKHTYQGETDAINMVVSYWPSAQAYLHWQASADYAPWKKKRLEAVRIRTHFIPTLAVAM